MILPTSSTNYYGSMISPGTDTTLMMDQSEPDSSAKIISVLPLFGWRECTMLISVVFNGMAAGMMFIFSNTILPALGQLSDEEGITAMVTINEVILNPLFQLLFVGGLVSIIPVVEAFCCGTARATSTTSTKSTTIQKGPAHWYALASTVVYLLGQIGITATQNIPRNNALLALDATSQAASDYWRQEFLAKWASWNTARCIFATIASVLGMLSFRFMKK